jgi:hypothetical protein
MKAKGHIRLSYPGTSRNKGCRASRVELSRPIPERDLSTSDVQTLCLVTAMSLLGRLPSNRIGAPTGIAGFPDPDEVQQLPLTLRAFRGRPDENKTCHSFSLVSTKDLRSTQPIKCRD